MTAGQAYHGWHVAPVKDRQYKDVTYHSRLEMKRACELDLLFSTITGYWRRQVKIPLGEDCTTRMDFVCLEVFEEPGEQPTYYEWAEEVEGRRTSKHRRVRRLWKKYGPLTNGDWPIPLRVFMPHKDWKVKGWITETIERETIKETEDGK